MTKLNMTSELFVTGGFRKPNVQKNLFENNYEREKGPCYLQFHKLYDNTWVVTTDVCNINLVEREANETPRDTIFICDPFYEAPYWENLNEIKYALLFVRDCCDLMSQPFMKVSFGVVNVPQAPNGIMHLCIYICILLITGCQFSKICLAACRYC